MSSDNTAQDTLVYITIPSDVENKRVDSYLAGCEELELTRNRIQQLIEKGLITLDGETISKKYIVRGGESLAVTIPPPTPSRLTAENIPLDIVYEDDYLLVVNKPAGLLTHPGRGNFGGTLANALVYHFENLTKLPGKERPGLLHRLDRNTSGLLVVARDDKTYLRLKRQMQGHRIKRTYLAVVCGHLKKEEGTIDLPIGRSLTDRVKMAVSGTASREAITHYRLLERYRTYDLLEVDLETGRTHQIRVHLSHLGHPVLGDPDYGGRENWHRGIFAPERPLGKKLLKMLKRQALHARSLRFVHPATKEEVCFEAEMPEDMKQVLEILRDEGR